MRLYVPELGSIITLNKPWTFKLYHERRNKLLKFVDENIIGKYYCGDDEYNEVTLPVGTVLKFSRIYIRQGCKDYSSVTFTIQSIPSEGIGEKIGKKKPRFWAKLSDINKIEYREYGELI